MTADTPGPSDAVVRHLFDRHWTRLCRLARLMLGDQAAAEEVVQEAFLRTFARWDRIRDTDRAGAYVRAAVVNLARSRIRRRGVEQRVNAVTHAREGAGRPPTGEREGMDPADCARVAQAVRSLPPRQRAAVVLRYYEDMAEADIAATLGCSAGTVKSQLAKARRSLEPLLAGLAGAEPIEGGPSPAGPTRAGGGERT